MSLAWTQTASKAPGHLARDWDRWVDTKATLGTDTKLQKRKRGTSQPEVLRQPPLVCKVSAPIGGPSWSSLHGSPFTISKRLLATLLFSCFHGNIVPGKKPKYYYNHPEDRRNSKWLSL